MAPFGPIVSSWRMGCIPDDPGYGLQASIALNYLMMFSFYAGWQLLAMSVGRWWLGIAAYVGAGLIVGLVGFALSLMTKGAAAIVELPWFIAFYAAFWPFLLLVIFRIFGWTIG
jgi:hypothetical protein